MPTEELTSTSIDIDRTRGDFRYDEKHEFDAGVGLTHDTIDYIVNVKGEPDWIREFRLKALILTRKVLDILCFAAQLRDFVSQLHQF